MTSEAPPVAGADRPPDYLRTALSPRMLGLLVLLLAAAAVCARLGMWQLDRAEIRSDSQTEAQAQQIETAPAEPLAEILEPQSPVPGDLVGRKVHVSGELGTDELLVADRPLDGRSGFLVLTPMTVDGAVLPVVRGWVPDLATAQSLAPAPGGTVQVTGYLQGGEAASSNGLPPGQVDAVSPAELVNRWGGPIYGAYVVASEVQPAQDPGLTLMPPPTPPDGGLNIQNLAYALQWWIFGAFGVILWIRLVRDEAREAVEADAQSREDRDGR